MPAPEFDPSRPFETEPMRPTFDPSAPFDQDQPSTGAAAGRGLVQGATLGFGDELAGALGSPVLHAYRAMVGRNGPTLTPQAQADLVAHPELRVDNSHAPSMLEDYRALRDQERQKNAEASAAHPLAYGGTEMAGAALTSLVPGLGFARGTKMLGMVGKSALAGGLSGLGDSQADVTRGELGRASLDAGVGAGMGAGLGYAGARLGGFAGKAGEEVRLANADAGRAAAMKAQKAVDAARGALGGDTASVLDAARSYELAISSPIATAEQKAAAQAALNDPRFVEVYRQALQNKLELGAEKLGGRLLNSRAAYETAAAARTPQAIEQAAEDSMAQPLKRKVLPRLALYGERLVPAAVGTAFGGIPGAAVGTAMGLVMGKPGTAFANMVRDPGVRRAMWSGLQTGASALSPLVQNSAAPAALELSPSIAAKIAALRGRAKPQATLDLETDTP